MFRTTLELALQHPAATLLRARTAAETVRGLGVRILAAGTGAEWFAAR